MVNENNTSGYIHIMIPAEYMHVYRRLAVLLADYGEDMLKDCKASCKDRNAGVIECYNMFNAAVAAKELGKTKLADLIIKYISAKIDYIYTQNGEDIPDPVDPDYPGPVENQYWYVGQINATRSQFEGLSAAELLNNAVAYTILYNTVTLNINSSCWYIMVPNYIHVQSAKYTSGNITTEFTQEMIENGFVTGIIHEPIDIGGITYNVYVNRDFNFIDSNTPAEVKLKQ